LKEAGHWPEKRVGIGRKPGRQRAGNRKGNGERRKKKFSGGDVHSKLVS